MQSLLLLLLLSSSLCLHSLAQQQQQGKNSPSPAERDIHVFRARAHLAGRDYLRRLGRSPPETMHTVVFAVRQRNVHKLHALLMAVSEPSSPQYGQHWSRAQVGELTSNAEASAAVLAFLTQGKHDNNTVQVTRRSLFDEYLTLSAPVRVWEEVFATQFFAFAHDDWRGRTLHRAMEYSLPRSLAPHVSSVGYVVDFPPRRRPSPVILSRNSSSPSLSLKAGGQVNPNFIAEHYNIFNRHGNAFTSQMVYSTIGQTVSPSDLSVFQNTFALPQQGIAQAYNGYVDDNACVESVEHCAEANLDMQYLMGTALGVPTISYYDGAHSWYHWMADVASFADPPKVISVSYGSLETDVSADEFNGCETEAQKLGLMGISLIVASGDDGASGSGVHQGNKECGYFPDFPASSQYWTAVGGTNGPQFGNKEIACASNAGGDITTGGGFSNVDSTPHWQSSAIAGYLDRINNGATPAPASGFNTGGRGYPDVSLIANSYAIIANGQQVFVAGTSASCPVFAGFVSLVNSARLEAGKSTMGFLNPFLYQYAGSFAIDITDGDNKCTRSSSKCCDQGFHTAEGWDPVTGLGAVDYQNFYNAAMNV